MDSKKEKELHDFWFGVDDGKFFLRPIVKRTKLKQRTK